MNSHIPHMREAIGAFSRQLSDTSPAVRAQAAEQLAQHAGKLLPSERASLIVKLAEMVREGSEQDEFIFGIHAIGCLGSQQMPAYATEEFPLRKKDVARTLIELSSLEWPKAKFRRTEDILIPCIKAIRNIAGKEPRTSVLGVLLFSLSSEKKQERLLGLAAILDLELAEPEAAQKAAFAMLDWDLEVRNQAKQTYMKISRGHFLRPALLCEAKEAKAAVHGFLGRSQLPHGELDAFKEFSVVSFLRGIRNGKVFSDALAERYLLSGQEIDRYAECALANCPSEGRKAELERRRNGLKGKIRQLRREQEILSRPEGISCALGSNLMEPAPKKAGFKIPVPQRRRVKSGKPGARPHRMKHPSSRVSLPWFRPPTIKA
ncbi:hypothetical protein GF412_04400 [Candidatus Micrarchaeota archaeon]|nr:hypothetical protein [Candidatus Micrarchaeota archaeon]MBD3418192.1 hypothetical protein [Candidatus Micrarchaeota archaeon]